MLSFTIPYILVISLWIEDNERDLLSPLEIYFFVSISSWYLSGSILLWFLSCLLCQHLSLLSTTIRRHFPLSAIVCCCFVIVYLYLPLQFVIIQHYQPLLCRFVVVCLPLSATICLATTNPVGVGVQFSLTRRRTHHLCASRTSAYCLHVTFCTSERHYATSIAVVKPSSMIWQTNLHVSKW